jgi:M6 family metalloprotease-like protein
MKHLYALFCSAVGLTLAVSSLAQPVPEMNSVTTRPATVLADPGPLVPPVPLPDPPVPAALSTGPAGTNFRLWIYDPRTRNSTLGAPGIFIAGPNSSTFVFRAAAADGTLYQTLAAGTYLFDVVEPASLSASMQRKRYTATISAAGALTVDGVTLDARGFAAVTVTQVNPALVALSARASGSALSYNPRSQCQLIDQITPTRTVNSGLSAGFPRVMTRLPNYGRLKALVVPVDFPDVPAASSPVTLYTPIVEGVRDFYYAQSYGRLAMDYTIAPNWLRMPFASTRYNLGEGSSNRDFGGYVREIIRLTDNLFEYEKFDMVYFLPPSNIPRSSIAIGPAYVSPFSTRNGYIINASTGGWDMFNVPVPNSARNWMAHETGHNFGIYDIDLDHESQTLGNWSVMANNWSRNAIEHTGWDRYLLGWLTGTQVTCLPKYNLTTSGTTVVLNPLVRQNMENKVAIIPLTTTKLLVLESRKSEGFDVIPAGREGVVAYTVDMTLGTLGGGYRIQRRPGSTDTVFFEDAALRTGDSITVEGVTVTVNALATTGDTVNVRLAAAATSPTLAVTRGGLGMGTVTSSPAGINCTPTCFASFAANSNVTLTPTAAAGSTFTGWGGDCTGTGPCTVAMNNVKNVTASFYGAGATGTYNGLWWVPAESGWGMSITQQAGINFMAWYTYDATGAPLWYVIPNCPIVGYGCSGEIYNVSGGAALTLPWNNPALSVASVGRGTFLFSDADNGRFDFTINGVAGTKQLSRQIYATGTSAPAVDYTGLYWAAPANSESGWGVAITQQFNVVFVAIYTYDAARKPVWYVASNCTLAGSTCTGALYQINGGRMPTAAWGSPTLNVAQVGSVTLNFANGSNGMMNFTINGASGSRAITRQVF